MPGNFHCGDFTDFVAFTGRCGRRCLLNDFERMFQISTVANYNHPEKWVHCDVLLHFNAVTSEKVTNLRNKSFFFAETEVGGMFISVLIAPEEK